MDARYAPSTRRTMDVAYKRWCAVADIYGWDHLIATEDDERGGKLVTFVLSMLGDTSLAWGSISNYVWGLSAYMKMQWQQDPRMGVESWTEFMAAVKVMAWVPHEPRRAVPLELLERMADSIDLASFRWVQFMFFVVVLLFTFSRSECPCPKNFTGKEGWDDAKHWMVRDFKFALVQGRYWALAVRFKGIKQDPRVERPTARGDGSDRDAHAQGGDDWSYVGDVPGHKLSPFLWYRRLMAFYDGPRAPTAPMFMAEDRRRPYTYRAGLTDMKEKVEEVSPDDTEFGLHGLRVSGYNLSKAGNGEDITVVHGLWQSTAHTRYERFSLASVCGIPAGMLGAQSPYADAQPAPPAQRAARQAGARRLATGLAAVSEEGDGGDDDEGDDVSAAVDGSASVGASSGDALGVGDADDEAGLALRVARALGQAAAVVSPLPLLRRTRRRLASS